MERMFSTEDLYLPSERQFRMEDKFALNLAKKNCIKLSSALGWDVAMVPKPRLTPNVDICAEIQKELPEAYARLKENVLALLLTAVFKSPDIENRLQGLSNICYYLACNSLCIQGAEDLRALDPYTKAFYVDEYPLALSAILNLVSASTKIVEVEGINKLAADHIDGCLVPKDLIDYLSKKSDLTEILREVVRLQKLAPELLLLESPFKALLESWQVLKKSEED